MLFKHHSRAVWAVLAVIALTFLSSLGYAATPNELMLGGGMLMAMGDIEIKDINALLEKQGQAFEEFKNANDARLKAIEEKGYAPADSREGFG